MSSKAKPNPQIQNSDTNNRYQHHVKELANQFGVAHKIDTSEQTLKARAEQRLQLQAQRQQENLESIFKLAFDTKGQDPQKELDPDWLAQYLKLAQDIRSPGMQKLWGRILKQEIVTPHSVSLRTLETLKKMTQKEAMVFQRLRMFTSTIGQDPSLKLITGIKSKPLFLSSFRQTNTNSLSINNFQLPYSSLLLLIELGLVLRTELETGTLNAQESLHFSYQESRYQLTPSNKALSFTYYRLSQSGQELAELLGHNTHEPYKESLLELINTHFIVEKI